MKKIIKKAILWFLGAIAVSFIAAIINSSVSGINLWVSFKNLCIRTCSFLINPDILLLILILILFSWIFHVNKKVRGFSDKNIKEILNKNDDLIRINDDLRKTCNKILGYQEKIIDENEKLKSKIIEIESVETDSEVYLILETLANMPNKSLEQDLLWHNHYKKQFKERKQSDFQIILNDLKERNLIHEFESGEWGEICFEITSEGLKYLKELKRKLEGPI